MINPPPILLLQQIHSSLKLRLTDFLGLSSLSLSESLTNAKDDTEARVDGDAGLLRDGFRVLEEEGAALGVPEDDP